MKYIYNYINTGTLVNNTQNKSLNYDQLAPWKSSWICALAAMDIQEQFLKIKKIFEHTDRKSIKLLTN